MLEFVDRILVLLPQPKNLKRLLLGHKPSLDPESLLSDMFSALIGKFLGIVSNSLLGNESDHSVLSLLEVKWPYHRFVFIGWVCCFKLDNIVIISRVFFYLLVDVGIASL